MVSLDIVHKGVDKIRGDLIHPVVIVAVLGEVAFHNIIYYDALVIAHGFNLSIFDSGQGICHHRQAGNTRCKPAGHLLVVKGHLKPLIAVAVVVIVDDIQCIYIDFGQPLHHILISIHYLIIIQILGGDGAVLGAHLLAADLVYAAVDGVEKAFCQVCSGTEKLHLFADPHCISLPTRILDTQQAIA